ncbi:MAG: response regulator [Firmicutes bacterium]|jgi:CheY-like chemotaxis protein|nr:response regulator [Bacillota bacterium]
MKVLLADPHSRVREMLSACCTLMGDRVEAVYCAAGGPDAVEKAVLFRVDVAVIDIAPPLTEGIRTIRALRESGFDRDIVSVSSAAYEHLEKDAMEAGSTAHLTKPFLLEEFIRVLTGDPVPSGMVTPFDPNGLGRRRGSGRRPLHITLEL